jgi:peroxiredoxin
METELDKLIDNAERKWLNLYKKGPTRTRWEKIPLQVGDKAPDFELQDATGKNISLSSFWETGPALIMFWRHYGCSCGRDRAKRLSVEYKDFVIAGANLVVIGQGEPERAALYAKINHIPCPILCDPTYKVYEAYDLLEGRASQVLFDAPDELLRCDPEAGMQESAERHGTERAAVDNPWQLPGEFVVDKKGIIQLAYRYQYCEDWPNQLVLLAGIKEAVWENK